MVFGNWPVSFTLRCLSIQFELVSSIYYYIIRLLQDESKLAVFLDIEEEPAESVIKSCNYSRTDFMVAGCLWGDAFRGARLLLRMYNTGRKLLTNSSPNTGVHDIQSESGDLTTTAPLSILKYT